MQDVSRKKFYNILLTVKTYNLNGIFQFDGQLIHLLLLLLGGELLAERCRTDDLMPSSLSPSLAFLHAVWTPKFRGWTSSSINCSQPGGSWVTDGPPPVCRWSFRAAVMTRWWSSSGAERARCPKNLRRKDFTLSETGKHSVVENQTVLGSRLLYNFNITGHYNSFIKNLFSAKSKEWILALVSLQRLKWRITEKRCRGNGTYKL